MPGPFVNIHDGSVAPRIEKIEDIGNLPWRGNHAADHHLFDACEAFIDGLPPADAERAGRWADYFGCGEGSDPRLPA